MTTALLLKVFGFVLFLICAIAFFWLAGDPTAQIDPDFVFGLGFVGFALWVASEFVPVRRTVAR